MDYFAAFDISASGMEVQKVRLDTIALNLANVNTTRTASGGPYRPLEVVVGQRTDERFADLVTGLQGQYGGARVVDVRPKSVEPRLVYDPKNPDANSDGYVAYPKINPVSEMVNLLETTRAYEANVRAVNAAKTMALHALDLGE
jgi:flagellar basal-body rod protein FlgC